MEGTKGRGGELGLLRTWGVLGKRRVSGEDEVGVVVQFVEERERRKRREKKMEAAKQYLVELLSLGVGDDG